MEQIRKLKLKRKAVCFSCTRVSLKHVTNECRKTKTNVIDEVAICFRLTFSLVKESSVSSVDQSEGMLSVSVNLRLTIFRLFYNLLNAVFSCLSLVYGRRSACHLPLARLVAEWRRFRVQSLNNRLRGNAMEQRQTAVDGNHQVIRNRYNMM